MSTTQLENNNNIKLYKQPSSISELIMGLLFGTYFLTVQTIELSLSIYVLRENKLETYSEYLLFKGHAPIWKWWQLFSTIIVLLSIIPTVRDLLQTFTRKATFKRHLLDIVKALQLFTALYIAITRVLPLENKLTQTTSKDNIRDLKFFQWIIFLLNIIGWLIPIFKYHDGKNNEHIHSKKKTQ